MVKRLQFTNTSKWNSDPWFRTLSPIHKLFWVYVNDSCDHAGFWVVDFRLAEFLIGEGLNENEIMEVFMDRISLIQTDLWWIKEYCIIQSKTILARDEKSKPRKSMVDLMIQYGVYEEYEKLFFKTYPGYLKPMDTLKDKNKDKEKEEEKNKNAYKERDKNKDENRDEEKEMPF